MKKLLLILLCSPMIGFGQLTYISDFNFCLLLDQLGIECDVMGGDGTVEKKIIIE